MARDKGLSIRVITRARDVIRPHVDIVKPFTQFYMTLIWKRRSNYTCMPDWVFTWNPAGNIYHPQQVQRFLQLPESLRIGSMWEVSDGSIQMDHDEKCRLIRTVFQGCGTERGSRMPRKNWLLICG